MKTYFILFFLLLTGLMSNAQDANVLSITDKGQTQEIKNETNNTVEILDVKNFISRASDFRIYMNRKRKVQNIKMLFPKINMEKKA